MGPLALLQAKVLLQMLTVGIRGACFRARHGVFAEEAVLGAEFEVDIACRLTDSKLPDGSDALANTINYGSLLDIASAAMEPPTALLETVVARIVEAVRTSAGDRLAGLEVEMRKMQPPLPGRPGVAFVRWEEGRQDIVELEGA